MKKTRQTNNLRNRSKSRNSNISSTEFTISKDSKNNSKDEKEAQLTTKDGNQTIELSTGTSETEETNNFDNCSKSGKSNIGSTKFLTNKDSKNNSKDDEEAQLTTKEGNRTIELSTRTSELKETEETKNSRNCSKPNSDISTAVTTTPTTTRKTKHNV